MDTMSSKPKFVVVLFLFFFWIWGGFSAPAIASTYILVAAPLAPDFDHYVKIYNSGGTIAVDSLPSFIKSDLPGGTTPLDFDTGVLSSGGASGQVICHAELGNLGVYAEAVSASPTSAMAVGFVRFMDSITVTPLKADGTVDMNLLFSGGTYQGGLRVDGVATGNGYWAASNGIDYKTTITGGATGQQDYDGLFNARTNIILGKPFDYGLQLYVSAGGTNTSGSADYLATATWDMGLIKVFDAGGNPVTNFSITFASGHDYYGGAPVPAPAALLLFGSGLLGLVGLRSKVRR